MRDFTLTIYKKLLAEILQAEYRFVTFAEFVQDPGNKKKTIILRHDVDRLPEQALMMAKIEHEMGVKASYYFRFRQNGFDTTFIKDIAALGHEIGYHYETMDTYRGNIEKAWHEFKRNLAILRNVVSVTTICRHGSPRSKWDNGEIWKVHDYKALGIVGEPYYDIDFNEVMYLTDTGRRWDGFRVNVRDKVIGQRREAMGDGDKKIGDRQWVMGDGEERRQETENRGQKESRGAVCDPPVLNHEIVVSSQESVVSSKKIEAAKKMKLHSTMDIIKALENGLLPDKIMLTIHPQRWSEQWLPWIWELCWQNVKNGVKYFLVRKR